MVAGEREVHVIAKVDARVHDRVALDEIELYGELIIAASQSEGRLTQPEIDSVLGIASSEDLTVS